MQTKYFSGLLFFLFLAFRAIAGGDTTHAVKKIQMTILGVGTESAQVAIIGNVATGDFHGAQVAGVFNTANEKTDGAQVAGCFNYAGDTMRGVQMAGFMNAVDGNVEGLQASGSINLAHGNVSGLQASGGANIISGDVERCQLAGGANIARNVTGLQAAGGANLAHDVKGFQLSGGMNYAHDISGLQASSGLNIASGTVKGLQVCGGLNVARNVTGVQLGVVNFADSCSGASIGFFSFVRTGYHKIEVGYNEALPFNIAFRTGTTKFYNTFSFGADFRQQLPYWAFGYGIGTEIPLYKKLAMNIDLSTHHINQDGFSFSVSDLYKLHATVDFRLMKKLSLAAGPTLNVFVNDLNPGFGEQPVTGFAPWHFFSRIYSNDIQVKSWVGVDVSVRFL